MWYFCGVIAIAHILVLCGARALQAAPPQVSLVSPAQGAAFDSGEAVEIRAQATDADGRVRRVDFYDGSTKIGSDTTGPPYTVAVRLADGQHALTAVARDNSGQTATSPAVTVTVGPRVTPPHAGCPAGTIWVAVGADIQQLVGAAGEGASFCLQAGTHRLQAITPKRAQKFYGQPGAILNGARLITSVARESGYWVASGQTQQGERRIADECLPSRPRCAFPEALFLNDRALQAVATKRDVGPGQFFFDYEADTIYFVDDPTGKTLEASVSPYAFRGGASGVVIQNLIVEKYSTPIQYGAIGYNVPSNGWVISNVEARLNYAVGIIVGSNSHVRNSFLHHNGEMGLGCNGTDIVIQENEMAYNGFFAGLDPLWEGGGAKCARTTRLVVRNNYAHHNNAVGFWTDIDNIDTLYEGNRFEYNVNGGLSHEISYAAVIRHNRFKGNGYGFAVWLWGGAIQIQNSQDVEVYGNLVELTPEGGNGICLIQQNRGSGAYGPYVTARNHVHDNVIMSLSSDQGSWGAIADYDPAGMKAGGNRFESNQYYVSNTRDDHWAWVDAFYDWAAYRAISRQDAFSTVQTSAP